VYMQIIDCFTFYNELDMLEYRLEVLYPHVDSFVLVEATKTHAGKDKPLFFQDNRERFSKYMDKIIHIVDDGLFVPDTTSGEQWINEKHQRNEIDRGLKQLNLTPMDLIIISDLDEIPDPVRLVQCRERHYQIAYASLIQDMYYYNLNTRFLEKWHHAKIVSYEYYCASGSIPDNIRMGRSLQYVINGGWHLSYFGSSEFIKNKIENFAHQEFNNAHHTELSIISERIAKGTDIYGRDNVQIEKLPFSENAYIPPRAVELLSKYILE